MRRYGRINTTSCGDGSSSQSCEILIAVPAFIFQPVDPMGYSADGRRRPIKPFVIPRCAIETSGCANAQAGNPYSPAVVMDSGLARSLSSGSAWRGPLRARKDGVNFVRSMGFAGLNLSTGYGDLPVGHLVHPLAKISSPVGPNHLYKFAPSHPPEGRIRSSRTRGGRRGTR